MDTHSKTNRTFETIYPQVDKNSVALSHPHYKGRADRLDLITNKMVGFKAAIGEKNFTICDISEGGFSYAERVPVKKNLSFKQVKVKVDQIAVSNYGKALKYICFFEGEPERGGIEANGTIKNHTLFLVLSPDEIRRTVTSYLQSKSIRRSHDPQGFFLKLDLVMKKIERLRQNGCNEGSLGIVLNTTFQNLILEIGAPAEVFDKLYQGYIDKPVYVKYGVSVDEKKDALRLVQFATFKNAAQIKESSYNESDNQNQRLEQIEKLNEIYQFKDFVLIVWNNCLEHFSIESGLPLPKIQKASVAKRLKEDMDKFNGRLEKIADPEFMEGECEGLLNFICDGLYWYLIEMDKKYFDREVIKKEIRSVIQKSYNDCLNFGKSLN